jgi:predicted nucleotidyltransferase component of viral defense system
LPLIAEETCFALKGGTATNLFVRDMPRLSVDIDLTYVPVAPRAVSLKGLDTAMRRIAVRVKKAIPGAQSNTSQIEGAVTRLIVRQGGAQTKIEVTPVLRGCVFDPETRSVSGAAEAAFGFAEIAVVSLADLYVGKIVAARSARTSSSCGRRMRAARRAAEQAGCQGRRLPPRLS